MKNEYDWNLFIDDPENWFISCCSEEEAADVCGQIAKLMPSLKFGNGSYVSSRNNRFSELGYGHITYYYTRIAGGAARLFVSSELGWDDTESRRNELPLLDEGNEYDLKELEGFLSSIM